METGKGSYYLPFAALARILEKMNLSPTAEDPITIFSKHPQFLNLFGTI